jgi:hypothetical protein
LSDFQVHHQAKDLGAKATNRQFTVSLVSPTCGAQQLAICSRQLGILQIMQ